MRILAIAALALAAVPATLFAQATDAPICANGDLTRVRLSKITAGGSMAGFMDAVADHAAWYRAHGYRIEQRVAPVVTMAGGKPAISADEVMTYATGDNVPRDKQDDAWRAYVAKYRANSEMLFEKAVCLPKAG